MIKSNFHTHTAFCDGLNTVEELAGAAVALGMTSLGFSGHAYMPLEGIYGGMAPAVMIEYGRCVREVKEKYHGLINIFYGLENDAAYMNPCDPYDYTIGSVHCIKCGGKFYPVDSTEDIVGRLVKDEFKGDGLAFAEAYFDTVVEFASTKQADILGHIDLVRRFNACGARFFDETDPRYLRAAEAALERAVSSDYLIEVSTAPLARGFSDETYTSAHLLKHARGLNARVIVNSDAHSAANLLFAFDKAEAALREAGFTERWELAPDGLIAVGV